MSTSITIEQLKCFIAVSKEMNFRKAAKNLNMSQPPVTRHIANLEHNLKAIYMKEILGQSNLPKKALYF